MQFNLTTYKTLTGKKEIIEVKRERSSQAVIYKDDEPTYFVDCYDLHTEVNVLMNSLVLCQKKCIKSVVKNIGEKNNVNIYIKNTPLFTIGSTSETIELDLPPLPEEWLN